MLFNEPLTACHPTDLCYLSFWSAESNCDDGVEINAGIKNVCYRNATTSLSQ